MTFSFLTATLLASKKTSTADLLSLLNFLVINSVCECGCTCAMVHVRSKDGLSRVAAYLPLFEAGSLLMFLSLCCIFQSGSPPASGQFCSLSLTWCRRSVRGTDAHHWSHHLHEFQSRAIRLVQQAFSSTKHSPSVLLIPSNLTPYIQKHGCFSISFKGGFSPCLAYSIWNPTCNLFLYF